MRIVLHGQQAFGRAVLEKLLERGEHVVAVCTAPDREGRPADPVKQFAQEKNLPIHQPASWKTDEALELMRSFDADLCLMAYVLLFVPSKVLNAPKYGSIQYHPSLLPMHRGPSSINWPIAQGATRTGLTIFWPDDGLDEGPILLQVPCEIGPDDTLGDVYFKKLFPWGVDAMIDALDKVRDGNAPKTIQDLKQGSYESWFGKKQANLDWTQPVANVYNIIRASNPQPGAWTVHNGVELKIYNASRGEGQGVPGEILTVDENHFEVAADGGSIKIARVRADGETNKISAGDYVAQSGLTVGDKLGI